MLVSGSRVFSYYNFVGYFLWWLNFRVLAKRTFEVRAVRAFDRAIFPLVHGIESRLCPPPIGQSLIVVAMAGGQFISHRK